MGLEKWALRFGEAYQFIFRLPWDVYGLGSLKKLLAQYRAKLLQIMRVGCVKGGKFGVVNV